MSRPVIPSGPMPARVMIVGEAPGADEERLGTPFVGVSGNELTKMLSEAGINRNECFITNLIRIRPPNNDLGAFIAFKKKDVTADHRLLRDKMVRQCVIEGYELLKKEIAACKPHLIIAVGNCAMWSLTGKWGVTDWRGSVLATDIISDGPKCLVTYHPAAVLRQWSLRGIVVQDFRRAKREADFPELLAPPYRFIVRPNLETALGVLNALGNYADELCSPNTEIEHAPIDRPSSPLANRNSWRLLALDGRLNLSFGSEAPSLPWIQTPNPRSEVAVDATQQPTPSPRTSSSADLPSDTLHKPNTPSTPSTSIPTQRTETQSDVFGNLPPPNTGGEVESNRPGERAQSIRSGPPSLGDQKSLTLSVDIETRQGHIACIGIAWSDREALCIPLMCIEDSDGYWSLEEEALLLHKLYKLLTHPHIDVIGQNFIYDAQYIHRHWHFIPRFKRDTMLAQHVCFPSGGKIEPDGRIKPATNGMPKSLDFLASMYCEQYRFWKNDGKEWHEESEDKLWIYNCEDCVRTYEVDTVLQKTVDQLNLRSPHDFQQSLFYPVLRTMIRGMRANTELQAKMVFDLQDAAAERQAWLNQVIGHPLNIQSPKQVAEFFYREMGQKPYHNRKSGGETTDDETLEKIALREPLLKPIVNKILELRSIGVYTGTFLKSMLDYDGRLRCSFNIAGTVTFRFSSSENAFGSGTNMQNWSKGDE